jgi:hypothetical protein
MCFDRVRRKKRLEKKNARAFKKTDTAATLEERDNIKECARVAKYLADCMENADAKAKMEKVHVDLSYCNFVNDSKVKSLDRKISDALADLKILVSKKKQDQEDIDAAIDKVVMLVKERVSY